ncbi:MAG: hypothetical protein IJ897_03160, partial [Prevotella sp.]|nr:hypothetical protein [Prevotella sp.]
MGNGQNKPLKILLPKRKGPKPLVKTGRSSDFYQNLSKIAAQNGLFEKLASFWGLPYLDDYQNRPPNESFFENFSKKIWSVGKKVIPLHPLSQNTGYKSRAIFDIFYINRNCSSTRSKVYGLL